MGNVVYLCVNLQDTSYKADTVTNIWIFREGEKEKEKGNRGT